MSGVVGVPQSAATCAPHSDNLKKADWSLGWVSALDLQGRTVWIAAAQRDDGKCLVMRADSH
ncbi:MAG TPA: hypothetical protein VFU08_01405 [Candidatus Udaeobacter sp.]|nr:hypothetical protein [Candidatus Udaeobacter sp.]